MNSLSEESVCVMAEMPKDWEGFKAFLFSEENYDPLYISRLLCKNQVKEKVPFNELKPFLENQDLSIDARKRLLFLKEVNFLQLEDLEWVTDETPFLLIDLYASCLKGSEKVLFIDKLGKRFLNDYIGRLDDIDLVQKEKNIDYLSKKQQQVFFNENIYWDHFREDTRSLAFYIRSKQIPPSYQFLLETLFRFTQTYLSKSQVFTEMKVLPRYKESVFGPLVDESFS